MFLYIYKITCDKILDESKEEGGEDFEREETRKNFFLTIFPWIIACNKTTNRPFRSRIVDREEDESQRDKLGKERINSLAIFYTRRRIIRLRNRIHLHPSLKQENPCAIVVGGGRWGRKEKGERLKPSASGPVQISFKYQLRHLNTRTSFLRVHTQPTIFA